MVLFSLFWFFSLFAIFQMNQFVLGEYINRWQTTNSTKQPRDKPTKTRAQGGTDGTPTPTNNDQDNTTTDRPHQTNIQRPTDV